MDKMLITYQDALNLNFEIGEAAIIEVDESHFVKRKYHVGRWKKALWVVGAISRVTNDFVVTIVEKREI